MKIKKLIENIVKDSNDILSQRDLKKLIDKTTPNDDNENLKVKKRNVVAY